MFRDLLLPGAGTSPLLWLAMAPMRTTNQGWPCEEMRLLKHSFKELTKKNSLDAKQGLDEVIPIEADLRVWLLTRY